MAELKKPILHLLRVKDASAEALAKLYKALTGKDVTQQEIAEAQKKLDKARESRR